MYKFRAIVAPLLKSFTSKYSTFWTKAESVDNTDIDLYDRIYKREIVGCFKIVGVHDCYLVDLNNEKTQALINIDEKISNDDLEFMAASRKLSMAFLTQPSFYFYFQIFFDCKDYSHQQNLKI